MKGQEKGYSLLASMFPPQGPRWAAIAPEIENFLFRKPFLAEENVSMIDCEEDKAILVTFFRLSGLLMVGYRFTCPNSLAFNSSFRWDSMLGKEVIERLSTDEFVVIEESN